MANNSKIQWTESTWNPLAGCDPVSAGCRLCYAATMSYRLEAMGQEKYTGITKIVGNRKVFNGTLTFDYVALYKPISKKKPTMYFVNSMSDLFHKDVPVEFIDKVYAVMALTPQHTYQVLTKRPERMAEYFAMPDTLDRICTAANWMRASRGLMHLKCEYKMPWPNVWHGTSTEDQKNADERIPHLLSVPSAVRFISYEPALGPISFEKWLYITAPSTAGPWYDYTGKIKECTGYGGQAFQSKPSNYIHQIIIGGESGAGSRPFDLRWAFDIVEECESAGVACFVKQMGANPVYQGESLKLKDRKGGDMSEWPEALRVRQFPV